MFLTRKIIFFEYSPISRLPSGFTCYLETLKHSTTPGTANRKSQPKSVPDGSWQKHTHSSCFVVSKQWVLFVCFVLFRFSSSSGFWRQIVTVAQASLFHSWQFSCLWLSSSGSAEITCTHITPVMLQFLCQRQAGTATVSLLHVGIEGTEEGREQSRNQPTPQHTLLQQKWGILKKGENYFRRAWLHGGWIQSCGDTAGGDRKFHLEVRRRPPPPPFSFVN